MYPLFFRKVIGPNSNQQEDYSYFKHMHNSITQLGMATLGSSIKFMASTNFSSVNSSTGIGAGPTPLACTCSPQNGWSPKNGTIVVGHWVADKEDDR